MPSSPVYAVEVDVQKLIEDFVWNKYMKRLCVLKRCFIRRRDYIFDIRWSYFSFTDFPESDDIVRDEKTEPHVQYSTTYTCQTGNQQKHVFNAQGSQMDSKMVSLQNNYNIGGKLSLDVVGLNFNLSSDEKAEEKNETKKESTTTWSETTEFTLNENDSAKVVVEQYDHNVEKYFVVKTRLRLRPIHAGWGAPVFIKKKSNGEKVFQDEITSLGNLFERYAKDNDLVQIHPGEHAIEFPNNKTIMYDEVYIYSRGILKTKEENRNVSIVPANE